MRRLPLLVLLAACAPRVDGGADTDVAHSDPTGGSGTFRVALLSDPHVIGDGYTCCESPGLDTESIYKTRKRLRVARDLVNAIEPAPERVFVLGDVFHQNYAFPEVADYLDPTKGSAAWRAKEILDGFQAPVELLWGNHDYDLDSASREFSAEVFQAVFDTAPYHAVDLHGWKFLATNSQLGPTWDSSPMNAFLDTGEGSFGREQLQWMADQLAEGKPTFLMFHHHPLSALSHAEDPDGVWPDVFALIEAYKDTIAGILVGHLHRWVDVSVSFSGVPSYVMGSVRYDADDFWILELQDGGGSYEILDADKADWGSVYAWPGRYDGAHVTVDTTVAPEDDPAGPWPAWTGPPAWPPPGGE